MEEKMKREAKTMMEMLFKEYDVLGSGAITPEAMRKIVQIVVYNFDASEELEGVMEDYVKDQKYAIKNPKTKLMEFTVQKNAIDFPSAMAIVARFLTKSERRSSDAFAGKGLISFTDLPSSDALNTRRRSSAGKHRVF